MSKNLTSASKFLSKILRHKPESIGITLDKNGWADVENLINGIRSSINVFDLEMLFEIVRTDKKGRYEFSNDSNRIRATQGHSVDVDVELVEAQPPDVLYHGTIAHYLDNIYKGGLLKKDRQYVHLSENEETAKKVGARRGVPVILLVDSKKMHEEGVKFYLSKNGVWLVDWVPPQYLSESI